ncbi:SIMPL domain-containing protein [Jannaschia seohaensis]|uniref:26 kDa periplasmic immunogenic protein n=1 Tax=Jannaschia seohaensis TaxID=475081 RepID=A0A2Y9AFT0_9RHOB|nr:SIMPL domain-containing protein [Jannaschia seohaensis]PWJ21009.1 hypothetical protein BCF38_102256 [Jannaschia seohaensis]SSA41419.1 hypothetical protein SAMN05421539_102256 [Jannaschia seohaensis]
MRVATLLLFPLLMAFAAPAQEAPRLTVEGRGEVTQVPDMATIRVSVTREAEAAEAAMDALATAMDAVLERISAEAVAARDVQSSTVSLQPRWDRPDDRGAPRISGYEARATVTVRVRDLDRLGAVMSAVVDDGANGLDGLSFQMSDPRPAEDAARRAAFEDAMAKARLYAEAAGLTVGPILRLAEGGANLPGPAPMVQMEMARAMPIAPGEISEVVTVTLEIALVPAE